MSEIINGSTSSPYWDYRVLATPSSPDTAYNRTKVRFDVQITRIGNASYIAGQGTISLTVNDKADGGSTTYSSGTISYNINPVNVGTWYTLWSKELYVNHTTNGTKTCVVSSSWSNNVSPSTGSASGSFNLTTIPRYASFNLSVTDTTLTTATVKLKSDSTLSKIEYKVGNGSWVTKASLSVKEYNIALSNLAPETSYSLTVRVTRKDSGLTKTNDPITVTTKALATVIGTIAFVIGDNLTIQLSNPGNGVMDAAVRVAGSEWITRENITNPYTFEFTEAEIDSMYAACPNTNSPTAEVRVVTSLNGTSYTPKIKSGTATVINSNPILTDFTVADINEATTALTADSSKLIDGYSTALVTITPATGVNHATIVSYRVTAGTSSYPVSGLTATVPSINTSSITATAYDSRGNQTDLLQPVNLIGYSVPKIKSISTVRNNGADEAVVLKVDATAWYGNFGAAQNAVTLSYRYRQTSSAGDWSGWETITPTFSENNTVSFDDEIAGDLGINGFDSEKSYDVEVSLSDLLSSEIKSSIIDRGVATMSLYQDHVEFNGYVCATGMLKSDSGLQINGIDIDYIVEQGVSGIWTYRKWNSGIAECWARFDSSSVACTQKNSGAYSYYTDPITVTEFPFAFIQGTVRSFYSSQNAQIWYSSYNDSTATSNLHFRVNSTVSVTRSFAPHIYVTGQWK